MPPISQILQSVTNRLVLINVVIYFVLEALFAGQRSGFELYYWSSPNFQFWQLLSHMFLHASVSHLAFNMLALWSFGRVIERVWGNRRFLIFYLICGIGAAIIHLAIGNFQFQAIYTDLVSSGFSASQIESVLQYGRDISVGSPEVSREMLTEFYSLYHAPTVGASGAVYGVLVAFALLFPNFKIILIFLPVPIAAKYLVPALLLVDLTGGLTGITIFGQNIAHFAHLGGALVGFLLVMYWRNQARD